MKKRVLAFILMIILLMSNTMSVSAATGSVLPTLTKSESAEEKMQESTEMETTVEDTSDFVTEEEAADKPVTEDMSEAATEEVTGEEKTEEATDEQETEESSEYVTEEVTEPETSEAVTTETLTEEATTEIDTEAMTEEYTEVLLEEVPDSETENAVEVSFSDGADGETIVYAYPSLEEAVTCLKTDFEEVAGEYTFTFLKNAKLENNVTLPSFVKAAVFEAQRQTSEEDTVLAATLDFNGYTISTTATVKLYENILFTNTQEESSTFKLTGKDGSEAPLLEIISLPDTFSFVDEWQQAVDREVHAYTHVSKVSIAATLGTVKLNADESKNAHKISTSITAKELTVANGYWEVERAIVTNFVNQSGAYIKTLSNVKNVDNKANQTLVVDTYIQKTGGTTNLESDSKLIVKKSAVIYNTVLGGTDEAETGDVYLYRLPDIADGLGEEVTGTCTVAMEGKVTKAKDGILLRFGVLDGESEIVKLLPQYRTETENAESAVTQEEVKTKELSPRTIAFTTKIKNFPVELVKVNQQTEDSGYREVYQQDNAILVGRDWITIYTVQADETEKLLKSFIRWEDAVAYLNALSNSSMKYVVEILEDIDSNKPLTMSAKTGGITFRGKSDSEKDGGRIEICYSGDLKLLSDTTFENISLEAIKYNSKTKVYEPYQSKVTLNGKTLTLKNCEVDFYSVAGNASSKLVLSDVEKNTEEVPYHVEKGITALGYLEMENTVLEADNVTITNTLSMKSSEIQCKTKITVKDIVSRDARNVLSYGGGKNLLTVSGVITEENLSEESTETPLDEKVALIRTEYTEKEDGTQEFITVEKEVTIRKCAITLKVKALEDSGDYKEAVLANASKAGAGWFVVGSTWEEECRTITHAAYKKNNTIYCGEKEENVRLYSADKADGTYTFESAFATLQEAFTEIDKLAVSTKYYRVQLLKDTENIVTFANKGFTFPSKSAGVTVTALKTDAGLSEPSIYYKGNLTLKCPLVFEDITLVPTAKGSISLGNFSLTLKNCQVDISKTSTPFSAISGSGVTGTSALILFDTVLNVSGSIDKVGSLVFDGEALVSSQSDMVGMTKQISKKVALLPAIVAEGKVNVGDVELLKTGELTGLATVTRKNGKITQITPQITINGEVYSENGNTLYLDLLEKVSKEYRTVEMNVSEVTDIKRAGLRLAKGALVTYPNIRMKQGATDDILVKTGGYLTYFESGYGVELTFTENGKEYTLPCYTFGDAVAEINSRKNKNDYVITLTENCTEISGVDATVTPKALTMPNKNYVNSLTIQTDSASTYPNEVELGFTGNITFTSDVILNNVHFVQLVKSGKVYKRAEALKDDYPAAVTISTGGYELALEGNVTINTPLILNGGNKSKLTLNESGTITTLTNDFISEWEEGNNVIYGQITGFASLHLNGRNLEEGIRLTLKEYKKSRLLNSYTASNNRITNLDLVDGTVSVIGDTAKGSLSVTNLSVDNGEIKVGGKGNFKNVSLEGTQKASIQVDTDFTITGTLTSLTDNAMLFTRLKGSGKAPYLNVSGTVIRGKNINPIYVGVYRENTAPLEERNEAVALYNAPKVTAQLLTAAKADANDFRPIEITGFDNYKTGNGAYSATNLSGYMLMKSGSNIYVYDGSLVRIAVYYGILETEELEDIEAQERNLLGYFATFKEATTAVNAEKDKEQEYTYVLMGGNGTVGTILAPMAISLPSYAKQVKVTGLQEKNADSRTIYLSGSVSLSCDTVFEDVIFAPVKDKKATSFNLAAGGNDLTLTDVTISTALDKMALKDISGNGKQVIVLDSPELVITGAVTNAAQVVVKEDVSVKGSFKTEELILQNTNEEEAVTLLTKGTVTIGTVYNQGEKANTLEFSRTSNNKTCLTINKDIVNDSMEQLLELKQSESLQATVLSKEGIKATLSESKKLLILPKAATDGFEITASMINADKQKIDTDSLHIVKANKGIYLTDDSLEKEEVILTRTKDVEDESGAMAQTQVRTVCLDYTQAVNEINTLADKEATYVISFQSDGMPENDTEGVDTNVTDSNRYSSFVLPKANMTKSLVVQGFATDQAKLETTGESAENEFSRIALTGNISGYGKVTFQNLEWNPMKKGNDKTPVDMKLTISSDKTGANLIVDGVSTKVKDADSNSTAGFIHTIAGTKNKTNAEIKNCGELILKSGISNINELQLENTGLLSVKASTVNQLTLDETASWDSLDKLTVTDIYVPTKAEWNGETATPYIGIRQDKNENPLFTVNGEVKGGILLCKVYPVTTTLSAEDEIFAGNADITMQQGEDGSYKTYEGVYLAAAKKASADDFRAYAFRNMDASGNITENDCGITKENLVAYKVGAYVVNGNIANMALKITESKQEDGTDPVGIFYARSYEEAVTIIQNKADKTSYYQLQFLQTGTAENPAVVLTGKGGSAYGAFTIPDKAAGLIISGRTENEDSDIPVTLIKYTGSLKANVNVTFKNLLFTEGKTDRKQEDGFAETFAITPAPGGNYTMTFGESASTYGEEPMTEEDCGKLYFTSVTSSKGKIELNGNQVLCKGNVTLGSLTLQKGASLTAINEKSANSKINIANVYTDKDAQNVISTLSTLTLGNVSAVEENGENEIGALQVKTAFTTIKKMGAFGNSQLTISGMVENVNLTILPMVYDLTLETPAYREMMETDFEALLVRTGSKMDTYRRLAVMPKASLDTVFVMGTDGLRYDVTTSEYLYKYSGGVYLTNCAPQIRVTGYESKEEGGVYTEACYEAFFLDWGQAVKEIDKINEKTCYYKIELLESVGEDTPIGTLTMPSKAAEVCICSALGERTKEAENTASDVVTDSAMENAGLFFTGATVSIKCNTRMENIAPIRVKVSGKGEAAKYVPLTYTLQTGNFRVQQNGMPEKVTDAKGVSHKPSYGISGSSKGTWEWTGVEKEILSGITKISGVGTVIVDGENANVSDSSTSPVLELSGDISVAKLTLLHSKIQAKNINISQMVTLDNGHLVAGTTTSGDGKITIKDITLLDNGNLLSGKQDKSGNTLITINGILYEGEKVTDEALENGAMEVALRYNNGQSPARLYNGMVLLNAQKMPSSIFKPYYTILAQDGSMEREGMGINLETATESRPTAYALYKSGKAICYGKVRESREVSLKIGDSKLLTYFASFEDAVKEIGTISLYKDPSAKKKEYEEYTITLLKNVEIGNAKNNNSFSSISLPSKTSKLMIDGDGKILKFWGNVTLKCNTELCNIHMLPLKNVKGEAVATAVNYSIGNYTLRMNRMYSETEEGESLIGNVTGSSKTGTLNVVKNDMETETGTQAKPDLTLNQISGLRTLCLENGAYLRTKANVSVYEIVFAAGMESDTGVPAEEWQLPIVETKGNLTVTLIESQSKGVAEGEETLHGIIRKPISSVFTWNGVYEDRDGDKKKEYYSLILPSETENGKVKIEMMGTPCPIGTAIVNGKYLLCADGAEQIYAINRIASWDDGMKCNIYENGTTVYVADKE